MNQHQSISQLGLYAYDGEERAAYGSRASAFYAAAGVNDLPNQAELAARYVQQLRQQAATVLGGSIAASLLPIQYNGGLNWFWSDGEKMNSETYRYVSGAVVPSPTKAGLYQVGGEGSFVNLYKILITGMGWKLSAADKATLQKAQTASDAQQTAIVKTYVGIYGSPSSEQMKAAQAYNPIITTTFDYIIGYLAGYIWAGKPEKALTLQAMQTAQNLRELLQYAPPSAQTIIQELPAYLDAIGPASTIMDSQSLGSFTRNSILQNLNKPSLANKGVQLFNPPGTEYYSGYSSNLQPSDILAALNNASQQATTGFSAAASSSSSYDIAFSGQAGISWTGELLGISAGTSFRGDVARAQGAGSTMNITMSFPGVTVIPFFPTAWQQSSSSAVGWWAASVIYQAWTNFQAGDGAPTGYNFLNGVPGGITLGQNGLGVLSAVVVSDEPTVEIEFTEGNYDQFSSWLSTHTTVSVSLFGFIPIGSSSVDTYTAKATKSASGSSFKLKLTPPALGSGGVIPAAQQTVPVLAGQVTWAGASIAGALAGRPEPV